MKKVLIIGLALAFCLSLTAMNVWAGDETPKKDCTKTCPVKTCPMQKKAETEAAAAAAKDSTTAMQHDCKHEGKCESVTLGLEGIAAGDTGEKIVQALTGKDGIHKVNAIDPKTGQMVVCYNPDKIKGEELTKMVTELGYKVVVVPASEKKCPMSNN
ncbi:MAG: hypothetical protein PHR28_09935 [candidate division Zixibacteria bacterium]|nr:hypothetical protein [candidate division Zixibacteria bacterium]